MFCIITYTKIRLIGLNISLTSLITHKFLILQPLGSPAYKKNYNLEGARPWGITIPSPYFCTILSATYLQNNKKISKILKKMWVLYLHSIFMIPCCVLRTVPGPLDFYTPYGSILKLLAFPVRYAHQMHLKRAFFRHLNHIPIDNMISIMYIFLKK